MDTFQSSFLLPRRRVLFVALFIVYGVIVFFGFSQTASAACTPGDYSCGHWERSDGVTIYASTYYTAGCDDPWNASFDDCYAGSWSTEHLEWPSIWKTNPYVPPAGPVGMCTCEWFDTTDQPNELCTTHMGTPYPLSNPVSEAYCESRNVECSSTSGLGGTIGQGWGYRGCGWVQNPQCSDNIENDSDGFIDYPNDPDCTGPTDPTETPQFPDLIVGPTNTSNVAYGNTTPFSATVTNSGNATASNFPNIFQVANSDISNTIAYVPAQTIATLGASASNGISASYALPVGSYNVRACTNRDTNFAIGISESNQDNNCGASWVAFTVTNVAPTANAGINRSIQLPTNFIGPSGQSASDLDGTYTVSWVRIGGTGAANPTILNATTRNPTFNGMNSAGTYIFRLTVTDNGGLIATGDMTVNVNYPALSTTCSVSPTTGTTLTSFTWTAVPAGGTGSYTYSWSGTESLSGSTISVTKTYSITGGPKTGAVTVISGTQTVTNQPCLNSVTNVSAPPQPDLIVGPTNTSNVAYGNTTPFSATVTNSGNATASNFPNIFQVANREISNTIAYVPAQTIATLGVNASNGISASYSLPVGSYNVRACTNRDTTFAIGISESNQDNNCGPAGPLNWTPFTASAANVAPIAYAGIDRSIQLSAASVIISGATESDDVSVASRTWTKQSGPATTISYSQNANTLNPTISGLTLVGTYIFRLTVTDGPGLTATDDMTVTVTAPDLTAGPAPASTVVVGNATPFSATA